VVYLQNWSRYSFPLAVHYWSLGVEEQAYLIWPLVVYRRTNKGVLGIAIAGSILALLFRILMVALHRDLWPVYVNTFLRMDTLLIGAICACLLRDEKAVSLVRRRIGKYMPWMWIAPIATFACRMAMRSNLYANECLYYTIIALAFACLLMSVVLTMGTRSLLQRFFCSRLMIMFGKYSYGAYIWHLFVLTLFLKGEAAASISLPGFINFLLLILLTVGVSACSYRLIERPFLALKRHFDPDPGVIAKSVVASC
jgi:peptidoglycan/LPS O-acetylase OafA/YrhL